MDRRTAVTRRTGMILVACLVLAHIATGSSMVHMLVGPGATARPTNQVTAPIPTAPIAHGCRDGGVCAVADRPAEPVDVRAGLVVVVYVLLVVSVMPVAPHRRRSDEPRPVAPPHLSARVVLVI